MADVMSTSSHVDPDAQATVTDFIDYTEYLPSDIRRSLALIDKLNDSIYASHDKIHTLSEQWSTRVEGSEGASAEKVASNLRAQISYQKDLSRRYALASLAESRRLDQEIARHQSLLKITSLKLDALPLPPSRDPSPKPLSPQATRNEGVPSGPKIKLRLDKTKISGQTGRARGHRHRHRRMVVVPGEVLPPPNPNSPPSSDLSDWESDTPPPPSPGSRHFSHKPLKISKASRHEDSSSHKKKKDRQPRDPSRPGTNVHSTVAGISTSNALLMLTPPPINPIPGTRWAPWTRLTEYEMAKLRKRMKKNAVWTPSDTMIRRELNDAGRGPENYIKAKQRCEETGEEMVDCDNLAGRDPTEELKPGEIPLGSKSKLTNKGMSLNVQKKNKKLQMAKEMAMELAKEAARDDKDGKHSRSRHSGEADKAKEAARLRAETVESKLSLLGPQFRDLFTRPSGSLSPEKDRIVLKTPGRKRKRDFDPSRSDDLHGHSQLYSEIVVTPSPGSSAQAPSKRRKPHESPLQEGHSSLQIAGTTTTKVPLAPAAPSPGNAGTPTTRSGSAGGHRTEPRRLSLVIKPPAPPSRRSSRHSTPNADRAPSRQSSRDDAAGRRRKSVTPGTPAVVTLATSRRKRPAPGPVVNPQGGNAFSVGKRSRRPSKKSSRNRAGDGRDDGEEDEVDPNEPRYCQCNDVSWGTMVLCENPDCEKQWFHLECVGLLEIPGRRTKWWCPECSVNLGKERA